MAPAGQAQTDLPPALLDVPKGVIVRGIRPLSMGTGEIESPAGHVAWRATFAKCGDGQWAAFGFPSSPRATFETASPWALPVVL